MMSYLQNSTINIISNNITSNINLSANTSTDLNEGFIGAVYLSVFNFSSNIGNSSILAIVGGAYNVGEIGYVYNSTSYILNDTFQMNLTNGSSTVGFIANIMYNTSQILNFTLSGLMLG